MDCRDDDASDRPPPDPTERSKGVVAGTRFEDPVKAAAVRSKDAVEAAAVGSKDAVEAAAAGAKDAVKAAAATGVKDPVVAPHPPLKKNRTTKSTIVADDPKRLPRPPVAKAADPKHRRLQGGPTNKAGCNIIQSLGLQKQKKMSEGSSSQAPVSLGSQPETDSHPESFNESEANQSEAIEIDDDEEEEVEEEEEDGVEVGSKRKLTSVVWKEFKRVRWNGKIKAKCMYCSSKLGGETRSGTKHLHDHLKSCTLRKIHLSGNKTLSQASLRFTATDSGKVPVENYTFDQDIARKELGAMMVLHEYPLSMVDHAGFRRFVHALQPLFKIGTRNTLRKHIIDQYELERKKAIQYMAGINSRVAITSDMWTSDNQKRGYMAITAHFIDESWTLRNIIMRFIYVPAPHTHDVIGDELYDSLVDWNLDEKVLLGRHGVDCEDEVTKVKESLSDLMLEYHLEEDEPRVIKASAPAVGNSGFLSSFSARVASTKPAAIRFRSELDRYLEDEMVDILTKDFDILDWWKVAGTRYPTLRLIARDIFAIPITTVASESAFSTSGRVLSEHRSRLTSQMLEALMCSQDWIRNKYKGLVTDEGQPASFWSVLQEVQEGLQDLAI